MNKASGPGKRGQPIHPHGAEIIRALRTALAASAFETLELSVSCLYSAIQVVSNSTPS
jgi:hypothetical protein